MNDARHIPFNRPFATGREFQYIREAIANRHLSGDGEFTRRCHAWLETRVRSARALLTHSCTAALEMMAILADIGPGDEVIMPSFTFVSTANAFVLRGAVPVFVDIRADTLNLDERLVEEAITPRTRAIVAVHYAGVGCDMDAIMTIAERHGLAVIEDAAQALGSTYKRRPLASIGHLAALSFHETKNVISGEGGALVVNDERFIARSEIIWEKGTNRSGFFRGEVQKYTWIDVGSSFLPSEVLAAFLLAQLEDATQITARRLDLWRRYYDLCSRAELGPVRRPIVPVDCEHNAHMFYVLLPDSSTRADMLKELNARGVNAVFHYIPLHSSPAGLRFGRASGSLGVTDDASARLIRLPLYADMPDEAPAIVTSKLSDVLAALAT
jgi:dTDP-4-amino-4,6-dideoxygalactose transaminase